MSVVDTRNLMPSCVYLDSAISIDVRERIAAYAGAAGFTVIMPRLSLWHNPLPTPDRVFAYVIYDCVQHSSAENKALLKRLAFSAARIVLPDDFIREMLTYSPRPAACGIRARARLIISRHFVCQSHNDRRVWHDALNSTERQRPVVPFVQTSLTRPEPPPVEGSTRLDLTRREILVWFVNDWYALPIDNTGWVIGPNNEGPEHPQVRTAFARFPFGQIRYLLDGTGATLRYEVRATGLRFYVEGPGINGGEGRQLHRLYDYVVHVLAMRAQQEAVADEISDEAEANDEVCEPERVEFKPSYRRRQIDVD